MKKILPLFLSALLLSACSLIPPKTSPNQTETSSPAETKTEEKSFSGTIQDLISQNLPQKCTWQTTGEDNATTSGKMFISGNKFNQVINFADGKQVNSISDGQFVYTWGMPDPNKGMKFDLAQILKPAEEIKKDLENNPVSQGELNTFQNKTDFKCSPWIVDNSKFAPPADVTFTDTTELLNKAKSSACDICASIPDASAKASCLSASQCE